MTNETSVTLNAPSETVTITPKDVERAIHQLAYRKAYQKRPEVIMNRKRRAERIKAALEYIRLNPEVARAIEVKSEQ